MTLFSSLTEKQRITHLFNYILLRQFLQHGLTPYQHVLELAGVCSASSDQYIKLSEANQTKNSKDMQNVISRLEASNPFLKIPELSSSLSIGVVAEGMAICVFEIGVA